MTRHALNPAFTPIGPAGAGLPDGRNIQVKEASRLHHVGRLSPVTETSYRVFGTMISATRGIWSDIFCVSSCLTWCPCSSILSDRKI